MYRNHPATVGEALSLPPGWLPERLDGWYHFRHSTNSPDLDDFVDWYRAGGYEPPLQFGRDKQQYQSSSSFSTAMKASLGTETVPKVRIRFLPSFCFSSSFFFRVMSPP